MRMIINEFANSKDVYKETIRKYFRLLSGDASKDELLKMNYNAVQQYYKTVFNNVCKNLSDNIPYFKTMLPIKMIRPSSCGYDIDPDDLSPGAIYAFTYSMLTNKQANAKDCIALNHYIMNNYTQRALEELDIELAEQ